MRTTYSTGLGGGWTKVTSKTLTVVSKPKKKRSSAYSIGRITKSINNVDYDDGGSFSWVWSLIRLTVYPILLPFKLLGVWGGWFVYVGLYFYFF